MDRITESLLSDFVKDYNLQEIEKSKQFEMFGTYSVLSKEYPDEFSLEDVTITEQPDAGLDGIAIIVNGSLILDTDQIKEIIKINKSLEVKFIFIQCKRSSKFEANEIGNFVYGVKDFFSNSPSLSRSEQVEQLTKIQRYIYDNSVYMSKKNPSCEMFYVSTGKWDKNNNLAPRIETYKSDIGELNIFSEVEFNPVDARQLQQLYKLTKSKVSVEFNFPNSVVLPDIEGVQEAYIGFTSSSELKKLLTDTDGDLRRRLFYDNVRDFQGEQNRVNKEIHASVVDSCSEFVIRNNGITIIANSIHKVGNKFTINDFQIVNGCQTCNVIYNATKEVEFSFNIPLKLIITSDPKIINGVIQSTNSQTEVKPETLQALSSFQKSLEDFYNTFSSEKKLYYERRSKQYNDVAGVEKVRIVSIAAQIRAFASMFLNEPQRAGRYHGTLVKEIGNKLFRNDHNLMPYYTSSYALYRLESLLRSKLIEAKYRPYRYHIVMIFRILSGGIDHPSFNRKNIKDYCNKINEILWDQNKSLSHFTNACQIIKDTIELDDFSWERDTAKKQAFAEIVIRRAKEKAQSIQNT